MCHVTLVSTLTSIKTPSSHPINLLNTQLQIQYLRWIGFEAIQEHFRHVLFYEDPFQFHLFHHSPSP